MTTLKVVTATNVGKPVASIYELKSAADELFSATVAQIVKPVRRMLSRQAMR